MFFRFILVIFSLVTFLRGFHVSSCDLNCTDKPEFTPSRLVVKYGDPTSATCLICQHCQSKLSGLEVPEGKQTANGTTLTWMVGSTTEWEPYVSCYYNHNNTAHQCCSTLPVTVYQPPDNVSIGLVDHTGPMFEGHQYTVQCTVHNVAPVASLTVTFYRGQTALDQRQSNNRDKRPVTETFTLNITPSKEDDGGQYWCEAKLELGPEGPQLPPVVMSQNITATVHYQIQPGQHLQPKPAEIYTLLSVPVAAGVVLVIIISIFLFIKFKSP